MFAIRAERDYVIEEDFMKAARKVSDNKKLESKLDYKPVWCRVDVDFRNLFSFSMLSQS